MSPLKILITGGAGLLGQYLNTELSKKYSILTLYHNSEGNCKDYNSAQADINDHETIKGIFEDYKPDAVVHTAGVTTAAQADAMTAKEVNLTNILSVKNIAEQCEKHNAKLIYTSTDLVYAGYRGSFLKEDAKLIPVSLYAESKLMGETKIQETLGNYIILRTALLYGFGLNGKRNHFTQMFEDLKAGKSVRLFYDQYRSPLEVSDAARLIGELCGKDIKGEILNFGGSERISRADLGLLVCEKAGFDKDLVEKISMHEIEGMPQVADVSLDVSRLKSFGAEPLSLAESLNKIIKREAAV